MMTKTRIVEEEVVDDGRLLTPDELCERLKVTHRWLRRADENGTFSRVKVGRLNRYYLSEVEAYIKSQHIPASAA